VVPAGRRTSVPNRTTPRLTATRRVPHPFALFGATDPDLLRAAVPPKLRMLQLSRFSKRGHDAAEVGRIVIRRAEFFRPSGTGSVFYLSPTACAMGCILSPLRGWRRRRPDSRGRLSPHESSSDSTLASLSGSDPSTTLTASRVGPCRLTLTPHKTRLVTEVVNTFPSFQVL
jgi:hypothetical protein